MEKDANRRVTEDVALLLAGIAIANAGNPLGHIVVVVALGHVFER